MLWKPLPNGLMSYLKNSPKAFEVILNVFGGTSDTDSTPNPGMADVIINYIPSISRYHPIVILIRKITRPVLSQFRKILPPMRIGDAYVDFSPILAIIVITIIQWILLRFL